MDKRRHFHINKNSGNISKIKVDSHIHQHGQREAAKKQERAAEQIKTERGNNKTEKETRSESGRENHW